MIFIALILSLIAAFALLRMLRSAGFSQLSTDCTAIFALPVRLRSARAASFALIAQQSLHCAKRFALLASASLALLAQRALHCKLRLLRFALLALPALLCVACSDLREQPELQAEPVGDTYLTISLRYDSGKPSRAGTTDDDGKVVDGNGDPEDIYPNDDPYAVGTDAENTIHSIHIFIGNLNSLPAEGSRPENADELVVHQTVTGMGDDCKYRVFNFNISGGHLFKPDNGDYQLTTVLDDVKSYPNKVIYVATNLTTAQWQHICKNGVSAAYDFPSRTMSIAEDITKSNGFAMFCTHAKYQHFEKGVDYTSTPLQFSLRRIMAKVHVVVTKDPTNDTYALVKTYTIVNDEAQPDAKPTFQVRMADILYVANSLNTSTYLFQQFESNGNGSQLAVRDPNWESFISETNFVYHPINSWNNYEPAFKAIEAYDGTRMPDGNNDATCYYDGLYVPENTIKPDIDTEAEPVKDNNTSDTEYKTALQSYNTYVNNYTTNTTHMIVRAFVTPLLLKVNVGLVNYMYDEGSTQISAQMKAAWEEATHKDWDTQATDDTEIFEYYCPNKEVSDYITDYSLKYEGFNGLDKLAFFSRRESTTVEVEGVTTTYESTKFYCYSAAKIVSMTEAHELDNSKPVYNKGDNNSVKFEGFSLFTDGYAHYPVFLDVNLDGYKYTENGHISGSQQASTDRWWRSQIHRNTYYILVVDAFSGVAGGIDPTKEYIQVHTETIPYKQSWTADRDLTEDDPEADYPDDDEP